MVRTKRRRHNAAMLSIKFSRAYCLEYDRSVTAETLEGHTDTCLLRKVPTRSAIGVFKPNTSILHIVCCLCRLTRRTTDPMTDAKKQQFVRSSWLLLAVFGNGAIGSLVELKSPSFVPPYECVRNIGCRWLLPNRLQRENAAPAASLTAGHKSEFLSSVAVCPSIAAADLKGPSPILSIQLSRL